MDSESIPWLFDGKIVDNEHCQEYRGFVYLITNLLSHKRYIGKKLLKKPKYKKPRGKRRKKILVDSDWKQYWGSSKELLDDIEKLGYNNFKREIIRFCRTKGETNYYEAKYQFEYGVLESNDWYNGHIWCRIHKSHLNKKPT
jgi:hypothetical protein